MASEYILDHALERLLGTAAPALRAVGAARGLRWELDRRLVEGRSGAIVAFVREVRPLGGGTRRGTTPYLMKLDTYPDAGDGEFARHRKAFLDEPAFAHAYLTELAPEGHDLVPVGDGRWIVFQRVATQSVDGLGDKEEIHDLDVVSKALASVYAGGPVTTTLEPVRCEPSDFVGFCGRVVDVVLREWVSAPDHESMNVPAYLKAHLLKRTDEGKPLQVVESLLKHDWLLIGTDGERQPNPFPLLRADGPAAEVMVKALLGCAHGDLHVVNLLAPLAALTPGAPFRLIDLAKYESRGPLARDPAGFLLHFDESAQDAISWFLFCDEEERAEWIGDVPGWLADLAETVRRTAERWAHGHVRLDDWRAQWRLSLLGCALILLARGSTRVEDRVWLLRFASRITRRVLGPKRLPTSGLATEVTPEMLVVAPPVPSGSEDESWVEWFCDVQQRLSRKAATPEHRQRLAELHRSALAGEDREDEFLDLAREIDPKLFVTRDAGGHDGLVDEVLTCPLEEHRCGKVVRPRPGEDLARCSLLPGGMRHEFW